MPKRSHTADDYLRAHSTEVAIILAELAESAGVAGRAWALAVANGTDRPESALEKLIEAEIQLNHNARLEVTDSLRRIRAAIEMLDRELPDDEESSPPRA